MSVSLMRGFAELFKTYLCAGLLVLALILAVPNVSAAETIHLVTEEWPGLVDNAPDGPEGILWDIAREALEELGYEVRLEFVPWKRALKLVQDGERDGILGVGRNPKREMVFQYPDQYLLLSGTVVVSLLDSGFAYSGLQSLEGLSVGLSPGYSYSQAVRDADHFDRVSIPSIKSGLGMLQLGRIDAMFANRHVVLNEARRLGVLSRLSLSEETVSGGPVYVAFRMGIDQTLISEFSEKLKKRLTADR